MYPPEILRFYDTLFFIDPLFILRKFEFCVLQNNAFFLRRIPINSFAFIQMAFMELALRGNFLVFLRSIRNKIRSNLRKRIDER